MLWWFSSNHYIPCLMTYHCAWGNGTQIYGATTGPRFIRSISCHAQVHRQKIRAVWGFLPKWPLLDFKSIFLKTLFLWVTRFCREFKLSCLELWAVLVILWGRTIQRSIAKSWFNELIWNLLFMNTTEGLMWKKRTQMSVTWLTHEDGGFGLWIW